MVWTSGHSVHTHTHTHTNAHTCIYKSVDVYPSPLSPSFIKRTCLTYVCNVVTSLLCTATLPFLHPSPSCIPPLPESLPFLNPSPSCTPPLPASLPFLHPSLSCLLSSYLPLPVAIRVSHVGSSSRPAMPSVCLQLSCEWHTRPTLQRGVHQSPHTRRVEGGTSVCTIKTAANFAL